MSLLKKIFIFSILSIFISNISYFELVFGSKYIGWFLNITYLLALLLILFIPRKKEANIERLYIGAMLLGLIFHAFLPEKQPYLIKDSAKWIFLVIVLIASRKYSPPRLIFYILLAFFITNCILAVIEYTLQTNLFDYEYVEDISNYYIDKEFRAFALMHHPLASANVTLIIMSFLMISRDINWWIKVPLLALGAIAILCFNSRIAMIICGCLLIYNYVLYNMRPVYIVVLGVLVYSLFLNDIGSFIQQNTQIFGRLAAKDNLTDNSSQTRLLSYLYFWNAGWNFQDILLGGRDIKMPGTKLSLENGILLTISWWGWIVGTLKVILELIISYRCLTKYNIKDKFIVLIACWGTAFANNNSFATFVFAFFIISYLSINSLTNKKIKKTNNYIPFYRGKLNSI